MKNADIKKFLKSDLYQIFVEFVELVENGRIHQIESGASSMITHICFIKYFESIGNIWEELDSEIENGEKLKNIVGEFSTCLKHDIYVRDKNKKLIPLMDAMRLFIGDCLIDIKTQKENGIEFPKISIPEFKLVSRTGETLSQAKIESAVLDFIYQSTSAVGESYDEFYKSVRDYLRNEIKNKYDRSDNSKAQKEDSLTNEEKVQINNIRHRILDINVHNENVLNENFVEAEILYKYIKGCGEYELKFLLDELDKQRQVKIEWYKNKVNELNQQLENLVGEVKKQKTKDARESYRDALNQNLAQQEMYNKLIGFYQDVDSYEWVFPCVMEQLNQGAVSFLSDKVFHKFKGAEISSDDEKIRVLTYLINVNEMQRLGYLQKGVSLRRRSSSLVDKNNDIIVISKPIKKLKIRDRLCEVGCSNQSNLVLNNYIIRQNRLKLVDMVDRHETVLGRDGNKEDLHLEWSLLVNSISGYDWAEGPVYVKFKKENLTRGTMECELFMFIDDNIDCGVQLYRAEKSFSLWDEGQPAKHNLYGGETISAYKHLHTYNELDAVSRREKDLGYMDPSHLVSKQVEDEDFELWFDNICGITNSSIINERFERMTKNEK